MDQTMQIELYQGDFEDLIDLLQMSMGFDTSAGVRKLIAIEKARGTLYYTARQNGKVVGVIGFFYDPSGEVDEIEPPQIIDLAVLPEVRKQGIARAMVEFAINEVHQAGFSRLWLYTDGNNAGLLAFYRRLRFRLVSVTPDWFGEGTVKAVMRRDL